MTVVSRHQLSSDMQSRARQLIDQVGIVPLAEDRQWMPTICFSISEVALALWRRLQRLPIRLGAALGARLLLRHHRRLAAFHDMKLYTRRGRMRW